MQGCVCCIRFVLFSQVVNSYVEIEQVFDGIVQVSIFDFFNQDSVNFSKFFIVEVILFFVKLFGFIDKLYQVCFSSRFQVYQVYQVFFIDFVVVQVDCFIEFLEVFGGFCIGLEGIDVKLILSIYSFILGLKLVVVLFGGFLVVGLNNICFNWCFVCLCVLGCFLGSIWFLCCRL